MFFPIGLYKGKECVTHIKGFDLEDDADLHAAKMWGDYGYTFSRHVEAKDYNHAHEIISGGNGVRRR